MRHGTGLVSGWARRTLEAVAHVLAGFGVGESLTR